MDPIEKSSKPIRADSNVLIIISLLFYAMALFFPAMGSTDLGGMSGQFSVERGFSILITGWMGVFVLNVAWFANITYAVTLASLASENAVYYSIASLVLGLTSAINFDQTRVYLGFYLWIASFVCLVCYTLRRLE